MTEFLLGKGILSWSPSERITDRYGTVCLLGGPSGGPVRLTLAGCEGATGTLYVRVKKTRKATHAGDLFRKIYPSTPPLGAEIILGQGELARARDAPSHVVGLITFDDRPTDWLDPNQLFRAIQQTVELRFRAWGAINDQPRLILPPPVPAEVKMIVVKGGQP